jgi:hypothetical protein
LPDHLLIRRERAYVWTLRLTRPDADPVLIGQVCRTAAGYIAQSAHGAKLADPATGQIEFESLQAAADQLAEVHRAGEAPVPAPTA